jgi:DnaJ domain
MQNGHPPHILTTARRLPSPIGRARCRQQMPISAIRPRSVALQGRGESLKNPSAEVKYGMIRNDDPKGYYGALGLACNASHAQVVHAYREWVKKYHPDANKSGNSSDFLRVKEAYDTLSDPGRRHAYDSTAHESPSASPPESSWTEGKGTNPSSQEVNAVRCCCCGAISAQPRYCVFHRVVSVLFYTHASEIRGVHCVGCAKARSLKESMICWVLGWWSIIGIFQTPIALLRNLPIGRQTSRGECPPSADAKRVLSSTEAVCTCTLMSLPS